MARSPDESPFDPDLDTPSPALPPISVESIVDYQRLVVNPFLAVLGWVIGLELAPWFRVFSKPMQGFPGLHAVLFLSIGIGCLIGPGLLIQYHCLDCGATGWLYRSRKHACLDVIARARDRVFARRFLGLGVKNQLGGWLYVVPTAYTVLKIVLWKLR